MSGLAKKMAKAVCPTPLWWFLRGVFGWRWFEGNFRTWEEARIAGSGYDDEAIARRVFEGTTEVREGRAAFERDGVTFAEYVPETGLLEAFALIAHEAGEVGDVIDFGGGMGTTYWRHRRAWPSLGVRAWDVVEQPTFLRLAEQGDGGPLRFFSTVAAAERARRHRVLLASTSLQYLPRPKEALGEWMGLGLEWILLNNLPLHRSGPDRIALQRVPPEIYPASYPVWFFNRAEFLRSLAGRYDVVREFASEAEWQVGWRRYASTGLLLKRRRAR